MAVDNKAFLCLVEKGISEVQSKMDKRYKLHVHRKILRNASHRHIIGSFIDLNNSKFL